MPRAFRAHIVAALPAVSNAMPFQRLAKPTPSNAYNFVLSLRPPVQCPATHHIPLPMPRPPASGASGSLSTAYPPLLQDMMGTPGIFRRRLFRSRSFVATRYTRCVLTRVTMPAESRQQQTSHRTETLSHSVPQNQRGCRRKNSQSSAYVPLWSHCNLSHRSSRAICKAILYFGPSFSNSAITQDVMIGVHEAYSVSMSLTRSQVSCIFLL